MNKFKTLRLVAAVTLGALVWAGEPGAASAKPVAIVALGDSLTAGLGLGAADAFPDQLEAALKARGHDVTVANAGVSGDTTKDGLARLDWSVPANADIVIVELGANDALRGLDPSTTREILSDIVSRLTERGQKVLIAGMLAPPNMGDGYANAFNPIFPELAAQYHAALYPFFLDGVADDPTLNQADGIHPTAAGVAKIVTGILPQVEALVSAAAGG